MVKLSAAAKGPGNEAVAGPKRQRRLRPDAVKPSRKPKAAETVAAQLRAQIVTGYLRPGDKLHSETMLQEQFGVSRPTLREALRLLESESLIRISRGARGGAFITALDPRVTAKQVGVYLQMAGTTLQDVWQARMALEPFAARLLAERRDERVIAQLEATLVASREAIDDPVVFARATADFSSILARSCGNNTIELLAFLIQEIVGREQAQATRNTFAAANMDKYRDLGVRSRAKMLQILRTGDAAQAEAFWRSHLEGSAAESLSAYRAQTPIDVLSEPPAEA